MWFEPEEGLNDCNHSRHPRAPRSALLSFAVAAFVTARVVPVRHLLTRTEAQSAIGLLISAALLTLGVARVADWRRNRREGPSEWT